MPPKTSSQQPDRNNDRRRGGGDRKGGRGRGDKREPSEYAEATLSLDRVTRVVKGGRRMRFRAVVVIGNRKGKVGLGTGKAAEVQAAIKKASSAAKRALIRIPIVNGTIPHVVEHKFKAARLRLIPASEGTGIIAGGALRVILDHAGVKDVLSKRFGSRNKLVNAQATMQALQMLRGTPAPDTPEAAKQTSTILTPDGKIVTVDGPEEEMEIRTGGVEITEISQADVAEGFTTKGDITGQE